jgi:NADPH:quinone reductase-like Zn-dependent oxidoreductase
MSGSRSPRCCPSEDDSDREIDALNRWVVNALGPDGPRTIAMSLRALAVGGHVSLIGASLTPSATRLDPLLLTGRGITLGSISVGSRVDFEAMNRAIEMRRLRPGINRMFPPAETKEAYRNFEGRRHFGKVVVTHRSCA